MNKFTGQRILLATVMVQAVLIIGLWFGPAAQQVPARSDDPTALVQ